MKIVYYDPLMLMEDGFLKKTFYETEQYHFLKGLQEKGNEIICFTPLLVEKQNIIDGIKLFHIGNISEKTPYGDAFHTYMNFYPCDVLIHKPKINDSVRKAKLNISLMDYQDYEISILDIFERFTQNKNKLYHYLVYTSDFYAACLLNEIHGLGFDEKWKYYGVEKNFWEVEEEQEETFHDFQKQGENHSIGKFERQEKLLSRLPMIFKILDDLEDGSHVLDYGCRQGEITIYLANKYPHLNFTGIDISKSQIEYGKPYIKKLGLENIKLIQGSKPSQVDQKFDVVLCTEVLEHVWYYRDFLIDLEKSCKIDGNVFLSTPLGVFESLTFFKIENGKRQHLHNFEEEDIKDLMGHKKDCFFFFAPSHPSIFGEKSGNLGWGWTVTDYDNFGEIDYNRKFLIQNPNMNHQFLENIFEE